MQFHRSTHAGSLRPTAANKILDMSADPAIISLAAGIAVAFPLGIQYRKKVAEAELGTAEEEAKRIIDGYFTAYPKVKEYMERVVAQARETGYVETIFGRRRYLPDIRSANSVVRSLAERNAINAPIQGSAADIIKIAMNRIHREFAARGIHSKVILQVHDELVIDMLREEQEEVTALVREAMEHAARLRVELVVECGVGENWLEAH